jgi:methyl coenzyme M reductase alpha subunit
LEEEDVEDGFWKEILFDTNVEFIVEETEAAQLSFGSRATYLGRVQGLRSKTCEMMEVGSWEVGQLAVNTNWPVLLL